MVVTKVVAIFAGLALAAVAVGAGFIFFTESPGVSLPGRAPKVTSTSPVDGATNTPTNATIIVTFSKAMDPSTITIYTFTLKVGTHSIPGTLAREGQTATFKPTGNLGLLSAYTATITTGAKDTSGVALAANFSWSFTTVGEGCDCAAARVSSTYPAPGATGAATNANILATFTEAMDPSTITAATFYLKQGTTSVPGLVSFAGLTATFDPSADLVPSTIYTATVTNGAKDLGGGAMQADFSWNFTTGPACDCMEPRVASVSPANGATGTPVNGKVSATFTEMMNPSTITTSTFTLRQGTSSVSGTVTYAGVTATFDPTTDLASGIAYTATITAGAMDMAGNTLQANFSWSFTPGTIECDCILPRVTSTSPTSGVAVNSRVSATFSEAMDPQTVTVSTFLVAQGTTPVSGMVSYSGVTATFDPATDFAPNTTYSATLTLGIKDLAGHPIQAAFSWNFTTSASTCALTTVDLGAAAGFAVFAGSTVTNTGATMVTGDLGVSPGSEVTGFPPGAVVGTIHLTDTAAAAAMADLTTAYNDAAGRTLCPVSVAGNLGGMTLAPGLYKSTSSLEISSGDLTLDAQGDADAVFIFQIASTLDVAAGLKVILAGGAQSSNIFWQVGTSATLGTNSTFVGTILADQSISLSTGATLDGRALARIGAVTLDTNTVAKPSG